MDRTEITIASARYRCVNVDGPTIADCLRGAADLLDALTLGDPPLVSGMRFEHRGDLDGRHHWFLQVALFEDELSRLHPDDRDRLGVQVM